MNVLVNFAIYQLAWCLCVFLENAGGLIALPLLFVHLALSPCKVADLRMMGVLLVSGMVIDGALAYIGVLRFNVAALPIPFWLATIWLFLATLPQHSLKWLQKRLVLSAIFGAVGGPLAYLAGARAGAAHFGMEPVISLFILAIIWAILWPLVMLFARQEDCKKEIISDLNQAG